MRNINIVVNSVNYYDHFKIFRIHIYMDEYYKYKYYKYKQKYLLMKGGGNGDFTSLPSEMIQQISKFLRPQEKAKLKSTSTQIRQDIIDLDTSKSVYNEYVALLKEKGLENIKDNYDQTVDWRKRIDIIKSFGDINLSKVKEAQTTNALELAFDPFNKTNLINLNDLNNLFIGNLKDYKSIIIPIFYYVPQEIGNLKDLKSLIIRTINPYDKIIETIIPQEIGKLSNLETLDLHDCKIIIKKIPLEKLKLKKLLLDGTGSIKEIPPEITNMTSLTSLSLNKNYITEIPKEISKLVNLRALQLSYNKINVIPSEIGNLSNLQFLYIDHNQIIKIPSEIGNLNNLIILELKYNYITEIPSTIGNLYNLKELNLSNNQLTKIPPEIGNLLNLEQLFLNNNYLTEIPLSIGNLHRLYLLNLTNNKLTQIPSEIENLPNLDIYMGPEYY